MPELINIGAPSWPVEIDLREEISRDLAFCLPFYAESGLYDIGPRRYQYNTLGTDMGATIPRPSRYFNKFEVPFSLSTPADHFELNTGGNGILATLADCSLFVWMSGATASTRSVGGAAIYSERPDATSIWKLVAQPTSAQGTIGVNEFGLVHRDSSSTLTFASADVSIEDGGLHIIGFTKQGTSVQFYMDGIPQAQVTLNGTDTLTTDDPIIGFDDQDTGDNTELGVPLHFIAGWSRTLCAEEVFALWSPETRWDMLTAPWAQLAAAPTAVAAAAIMNQLQSGNVGADLYNGTIL